jgi:hypothetical protein
MAKRSITDNEIALIKAMLARGMKNRDIQFFFNRPDRPVNSGRISTIASGSYSNAAIIPAATDAELDHFLASVARTANVIGPTVGAPSSQRLSATVRALFTRSSEGAWRLASGESDEHECKVEFDAKKLTPVVRSIAALANNKGGYVFFGVPDKSFNVAGLDGAFAGTDIVTIVDKIKAHLSPTPIIAKGVVDLDGKQVGFIRVEKHQDRPVIVYRDGDGLNEGDIIFRYPGQSARIKFGDLRSLLEERDRRTQIALANAAGKLADLGTENALIVDTKKNVLEAEGRTILIDERLINEIKFIKEGEFQEKADTPTLKLVGSVSAVPINAPVVTKITHEALFQEKILTDFLVQAEIDQPLQYIFAAIAQPRKWIPIFYFARKADKTNAEVIEAVQAQKILQKGKKKVLIERLEGKTSAYTKAVSQAAKLMADGISEGNVPTPASVGEASMFASGLTAVKHTKAPVLALLATLQVCWNLGVNAEDNNAAGSIFKAACRVDEMAFYEA